MKYAFAANQQGDITIDPKKTPVPDELIFCLSDNGIGRPENLIAKGTGFGTESVNLPVQQLNGKLTSSINNGTRISVHFKHTNPSNGLTR